MTEGVGILEVIEGENLVSKTVLCRLYHDALKVVPRQPDSRSDKCMIGKAATGYSGSLRFEDLR